MSTKPAVTTQWDNIRINGHVLVVDHLLHIMHLSRDIVSNARNRISYAADGAEALEQYSHAQVSGDVFDLIIMDVQMPTVDGLTASTQLRADGCRCPILALTAATMQGEKERCLLAGCDDYLSKPV